MIPNPLSELAKDGHDIAVAWDNEAKPLPKVVQGAKYCYSFSVPSKSQFIHPEKATAKGFDAVCIGTTTLLTENRGDPSGPGTTDDDDLRATGAGHAGGEITSPLDDL